MNQSRVKLEILFTRVVNYVISGGLKAIFIFHFFMNFFFFNKDHISFFSFFAARIRVHSTLSYIPNPSYASL